eukprot:1152083-Pelagomonas_calceolata.AAC.2
MHEKMQLVQPAHAGRREIPVHQHPCQPLAAAAGVFGCALVLEEGSPFKPEHIPAGCCCSRTRTYAFRPKQAAWIGARFFIRSICRAK